VAQVIIAGSIYRRLKEEAERRGAAVDGVVVELLEAALGASLDPPERAEFHRGLAEKFLREAEELLTRGDYVQASEKAWGAAAQIVKAVAAKRGKELKSRGDLWQFVLEAAGENDELRRLWLILLTRTSTGGGSRLRGSDGCGRREAVCWEDEGAVR